MASRTLLVPYWIAPKVRPSAAAPTEWDGYLALVEPASALRVLCCTCAISYLSLSASERASQLDRRASPSCNCARGFLLHEPARCTKEKLHQGQPVQLTTAEAVGTKKRPPHDRVDHRRAVARPLARGGRGARHIRYSGRGDPSRLRPAVRLHESPARPRPPRAGRRTRRR